jgi:hypothetical protein
MVTLETLIIEGALIVGLCAVLDLIPYILRMQGKLENKERT